MQQRGFGLVEFIIYIAIASVVLGACFTLYQTTYVLRVKNQSIAEGEQQGYLVMQTMLQSIRNAETVTTPSAGATTTTLSVKPYDTTSTSVFSLTSGLLMIQEGAAPAQALSTNRITISNLNFRSLSRDASDRLVRISFTVTLSNPTNRAEQNFTKTFTGSAAMRGVYP